MTEADLAAAVRFAVKSWMESNSLEDQLHALESPNELSRVLGEAVAAKLAEMNITVDAARAAVLSEPFFHLQDVFDASELPDTPEAFFPLPPCHGSIAGRAAALAAHGVMGLETISYLTENEGELFVNLVAMPGDGKEAVKSKDKMRGHTDGVSLPLRDELLASANGEDVWSLCAPSPDFVTLIGLRNPESVPTNVMPLGAVLHGVSLSDIEELKKPQFSVTAQFTFAKGMLAKTGDVQVAIDVPVLVNAAGGRVVRYSHSNVTPTEDTNHSAHDAIENFQASCEQSVVGVTVSPGDVLMVSNRECLHGRGVVGGEPGGSSRWIVRTYALDTKKLDDNRRHLGKHPRHILKP